MMTSCATCQGKTLRRTTAEVKRHIAGRLFTSRLPAQECVTCGTKYFAGQDLQGFELAAALTLATAGVTDPDALKFMRKVTGLSGKEFAELLGVRPETVSRWEAGRPAVDRATYAIIHQLLVDRAGGTTRTADYLRSLKHPRRLPRRVKIDPRAA